MPIQDDFVATQGRHGSYPWAKDFLNVNAHLPFSDAESVMATFPDLKVITPAGQGDYKARVDSVKDQCGVIIEVDTHVSA